MKAVRILLILLLAAGIGLAVFTLMVRQAVTLEDATPAEARREFDRVRDGFGAAEPLVVLDEAGRPGRRPPSEEGADTGPDPDGRKPERLRFLVYRAGEQRLVHADVPFWFFRIKGPAAQLALRKTDFDLDRLGITPAELERLGPRLVFEETKPNGDRVLVWTE